MVTKIIAVGLIILSSRVSMADQSASSRAKSNAKMKAAKNIESVLLNISPTKDFVEAFKEVDDFVEKTNRSDFTVDDFLKNFCKKSFRENLREKVHLIEKIAKNSKSLTPDSKKIFIENDPTLIMAKLNLGMEIMSFHATPKKMKPIDMCTKLVPDFCKNIKMYNSHGVESYVNKNCEIQSMSASDLDKAVSHAEESCAECSLDAFRLGIQEQKEKIYVCEDLNSEGYEWSYMTPNVGDTPNCKRQ